MGITVAMVGLTHPHSAAHLRTLHALDVVDEVLLYDPDAEARERAIAEWPKAQRGYADLEALLNRVDVPIVFVATANDVAPAIVMEAAKAGKHILCEKPCARSAKDMEPVLETLQQTGARFAVCYVWRANPGVVEMRDLVARGAIGSLTSVELRMITTQVRMRDPSHWLFRRNVAGGGILSWLGCHWLDLLRYVSQEEVVAVSALLGTLSGENIDVEDVASVSLQLSGGALGSLHAGYVLASGRLGYEKAGYDMAVIFRGTAGTLRLDGERGAQIVTLESQARGWRTAPRQVFRYTLPDVPAYGGAHGLAFVEQFISAALNKDGEIPASAEDAMQVLRILDAIYRSAESERVVRLDSSLREDRSLPS